MGRGAQALVRLLDPLPASSVSGAPRWRRPSKGLSGAARGVSPLFLSRSIAPEVCLASPERLAVPQGEAQSAEAQPLLLDGCVSP